MNKQGRAAAAFTASQFKKDASETASRERAVQREIDAADKQAASKKEPQAMQAGARIYPVPPLPKQHLKKPGQESDLELQPMYDAPYYKGSKKLLDKAALVTGGDSGIGRAVAVLFAREGADVAVAYLDEHEDAAETKRAVAERLAGHPAAGRLGHFGSVCGNDEYRLQRVRLDRFLKDRYV